MAKTLFFIGGQFLSLAHVDIVIVTTKIRYVIQQSMFFINTGNYIHFRNLGNFLCCQLCIAAGYRHNRLRIYFLCASNKLSGFSICQPCYRTCIDNVYISNVLFFYYLVPFVLKLLCNGCRFILVHFAS